MLRIENLVVSYGPINALKGISLNVEQGEIVTLIGSNGAGKSTTLSAITGLVRAQSGSIHFMGEASWFRPLYIGSGQRLTAKEKHLVTMPHLQIGFLNIPGPPFLVSHNNQFCGVRVSLFETVKSSENVIQILALMNESYKKEIFTPVREFPLDLRLLLFRKRFVGGIITRKNDIYLFRSYLK